MRFDDLVWDDDAERHVCERHGVDAAEAEEAFRDPDRRIRRVGRRRYQVLGRTEGGRGLAVFVDPIGRGRYELVTARPMTPGEARRYRGR